MTDESRETRPTLTSALLPVPHDRDRHSLTPDTVTRWYGFPVEFTRPAHGWISYPAEREAVAELMRDREHPDYDESWRPT